LKTRSAARDRLLETAGRLFGERGYACVGINEIIARAGVAKATFYQHFPSKEALAIAWLEAEGERTRRADRELLDDERPVRERLEARFDELRAWLKRGGFRGCPFCVTTAMTPPDSALRQPVETYREQGRDFWRQLAAQHEPNSKRARDLGDAWFLLHTGAMTEAHNLASPWPVKKAKRAALALAGWD